MSNIKLTLKFINSWQECKWDSLTSVLHKNIKSEIFWCGVEIEGTENFLKAIKKGNSFSTIANLELIDIVEWDKYCVSQWKGSYTNDIGKEINCKKYLS